MRKTHAFGRKSPHGIFEDIIREAKNSSQSEAIAVAEVLAEALEGCERDKHMAIGVRVGQEFIEWGRALTNVVKYTPYQVDSVYTALSDCLDQMYAMQPKFENDKDVGKAIDQAEIALCFMEDE